MTVSGGAGIGQGRRDGVRGPVRRIAAVMAAALVVATGMVAFAAPASAAPPGPDTLTSSADIGSYGCPTATTPITYPTVPSYWTASSSTPTVGTGIPFGTLTNAGDGSLTFQLPVPVAAVAVEYINTDNVSVGSAWGGWITPQYSGELSSVVAAARQTLPVTDGTIDLIFCVPTFGVAPVGSSSSTTLELGTTVPGTPAGLRDVHLTNTTGIAQQVSFTCTNPHVTVTLSSPGFLTRCPLGPPSNATFYATLGPGQSGELSVQLLPVANESAASVTDTLTVIATPIIGTAAVPLSQASQYAHLSLQGTVVDPGVTPVYLAEGAIHLGSVPAGAESPYVPVTVVNSDPTTDHEVTLSETYSSVFELDTSVASGGLPACDPTGGTDFFVPGGGSCTVGVRPNPSLDPAQLAFQIDGSDNVYDDLVLSTIDGPFTGSTVHETWSPPIDQFFGAPSVQVIGVPAGVAFRVPVTFGFRPSLQTTKYGASGTAASSNPGDLSVQGSDSTCDFSTGACTVHVSGTVLRGGPSLHGTITLTVTIPGSPAVDVSVDLTVGEAHPANDNLAHATYLKAAAQPDPATGDIANSTGDTTGATTESGEPLFTPTPYPGHDLASGTVWYHIVPPTSGYLFPWAHLAPTAAHPYQLLDVNVYADNGGTDPGSLVLPRLGSFQAWRVVANQPYWIQVATAPGNDPGPFELDVRDYTVPPQITDLAYAEYPQSIPAALDPGQSAPVATFVSPTPDTARDLRVGLLSTLADASYYAGSATLSVYKINSILDTVPTLTDLTTPGLPTTGQLVNPETNPDPLSSTPPQWPLGTYATYHFEAGASYVIVARNPSTTQTEWVEQWAQAPGPGGTGATPPTLSGFPAPAPVQVTHGTSSASVTWKDPTATAGDGVTPLVPTCAPGSGSLFAVGVTTVTCSITDPATNLSATGSFAVTVQATTPDAPALASVTATTDSLTATWGPPLWDGGSPVTASTISVNDPNQVSALNPLGTIATDTVSGSHLSDTISLSALAGTVFPGTQLTVTLVATNSVGDSPAATATTFLAPSGAAGSASGSNGTPASVTYTAGTTSYTTSATGTGNGTVVVSNYGAGTNPTNVKVPFSAGTAPMFDVVVDPNNKPTTVTVNTCPAPFGGKLWWFNSVANQWQVVSPTSVQSGCLTFTANNSVTNASSPTIDQLKGTVFALATPPASGTVVAAASSVTTGGSTTVTAHVIDAGSQPVVSSTVALSDGQTATTDGSGDAVFTVSSGTDGAVTYTASADGIDLGASAVVTYGSAPSITPPAPGDAVTGTAYSFGVTATGSPTWSATGLAAGLSVDPTTGTVSGTPAAAGTSTAKLTATNAFGAASVDVTIHVYDPVTITTTSLPDTYVGASFSSTVIAAGDTGTVTWSATGLPSWASINPFTGAISGLPDAAGTTTVHVTASGAHTSASQDLVLHVYALAVTSGELPDAGVGTPYSTTLIAAGGKGAIAWSATGLPAGLSLAPSTGVISGTPTAAVTMADVAVTAQDALGESVTVHVSLTVYSSIAITAPSTVDAEVGAAVSATPSAIGGKGAITWSATGLPSWATIDPATGKITGTPAATDVTASALTVKLTASSSLGTTTVNIALTVHAALAITTATLPAATSGTAYSTSLASSGGLTPVTWGATGLPTGLTISTSGTITGSTTVTGPATVAVTATDGLGVTATRSFTLTVNASPPPPAGQDLGLRLTASTFHSGESGTLTAAVRDTGTSAVTTPITVQVTLPSGLAYRRASGAGWTCTAAAGAPSGQVVTCTRTATLAVGATSTLTLTALPSVRGGTVLSVSAVVSTTSVDPTPADNAGVVSVTVRRG